MTVVSLSQRTVRPGGSLRVTDTVRNRGIATARRWAVAYYLSRDRIRDAGDAPLGRRAIRSVRPGKVSRDAKTVRIPKSAALGSYRVVACAYRVGRQGDTASCRASTGRLKVTARTGDRTPPTFTGLESATTCIPGPIDDERQAAYRLKWKPAADNVTPSNAIVYDIYQTTTKGGENFSAPTYTSDPGASSFITPPLSSKKSYYFVVRASDRAGNRDSNRIERAGENLCE